jgi:hypothetical protein
MTPEWPVTIFNDNKFNPIFPRLTLQAEVIDLQ